LPISQVMRAIKRCEATLRDPEPESYYTQIAQQTQSNVPRHP